MMAKYLIVTIAVLILAGMFLYAKLREAPRLPQTVTGINIRYHHGNKTKEVWLNKKEEFHGFWMSAFARVPNIDDGWKWERFGASSVIYVYDQSGEILMEIMYHEPESSRYGNPFIQISREKRYFLVNENWRTWLSGTIASHPQIYRVHMIVSPDLSVERIKAIAHSLNLVPEAVVWGSPPHDTRTVNLLFTKQINSEEKANLQDALTNSKKKQ